MKYFVKSQHTEVDVVRASDGSYDVTLFGNKSINVTQAELATNFTLSKTSDPAKDLIKGLARQIIDTEMMVDDGNSEALLNEAVGYALKIIKLT